LLAHEKERGIVAARIALAGFSQGGAMALHTSLRYPEKLAGVIALSCYLPLARELETERAPANQNTPIFMAHGAQDPVVPFAMGDESRRLLETAGYPVEWHSYPMPHALCEPEVADIRAFLGKLISVTR
jgi:phospholipase/carboxylesterase